MNHAADRRVLYYANGVQVADFGISKARKEPHDGEDEVAPTELSSAEQHTMGLGNAALCRSRDFQRIAEL
eukprot:3674471-Prymnesium_polylepis.1